MKKVQKNIILHILNLAAKKIMKMKVKKIMEVKVKKIMKMKKMNLKLQ